MKKRFTEEQIIGFLREADAGMPIKDLCRRHGFSEASYYLWRGKFGGLDVSDAKRLKAWKPRTPISRNFWPRPCRSGRWPARCCEKSGNHTPATRVVRTLTGHERHALRVVVMSASSLRYRPAPDRNITLRESIRTLAHRHRRYGAGMIYLKLRQAGEIVNHKRGSGSIRCRSRIGTHCCGPTLLMRSGPWTSCLTAVLMDGSSRISTSSMTPHMNRCSSGRSGQSAVSPLSASSTSPL